MLAKQNHKVNSVRNKHFKNNKILRKIKFWGGEITKLNHRHGYYIPIVS